MIDKTVLVTGANAGLGKETCRRLAMMGARVIMVCRNEEKGNDAKNEIIRLSQNPNISLFIADFASLEEVRKLATHIRNKYDRLDILVNNAGVFVTELQYTKDGHELQWAVNHLAPFLLTRLLMDKLEKSGKARIVTVSSVANYKGTINFEDLNLEKNYNGLIAYRQSKLANILFTFELADRLKNNSIAANCLHPGMVRTAFGHKYNNHWMGWGWMFMKPFMRPVESGCKSIIKLVTDENLSGVSGKYFNPEGKERTPNQIAYDKAVREKLWKVSEELTGLKKFE